MRVHHIELLCQDLELQVAKFCKCFGFSFLGTWKDQLCQKVKIVLEKNDISLILHQDENHSCDSIDNIALEVDDIYKLCENLDETILIAGPELLKERGRSDKFADKTASTMYTEPSSVKAALLKSPLGNVQHTILSKANYSGAFLPGFIPADENLPLHKIIGDSHGEFHIADHTTKATHEKYISHLDHITFAVRTGSTFRLMDWYKRNLGFKRCKVNSKERADGLTVKTRSQNGAKLGLRLTAMQYHFCCEESIKPPQDTCNEKFDVKFIFAESLVDQGPNQVDTFLEENLGPGVQHIGLATANIFKSVDIWKKNDVKFIIPPRHYYDEINDAIKMVKQNDLRKSLENSGVLLDLEESHSGINEFKYLLQVFTQPVFEKETFFFELIQRYGATGFGTGNIRALWRAVDAYLNDRNRDLVETASK